MTLRVSQRPQDCHGHQAPNDVDSANEVNTSSAPEVGGHQFDAKRLTVASAGKGGDGRHITMVVNGI